MSRPAAGSGDATVTLTAKIAKGEVTATKSFTVVVLQQIAGGLVAQFDFEDNLADSKGNFGAGAVTGSKIDAAGGSITYDSGVTARPAVFNGSSGINCRRTDLKQQI